MSFRIWSWIVTSRAVVGSSASSSLGFRRQRDRDHGALAHAAGELVRIVIDARTRRGNADMVEQGDGALANGRSIESAVGVQALANLLADGEDGVERRHRLLEDYGDLAAADRVQPMLRQLQQVDAAPVHLAGNLQRRTEQADDRSQRQALARPGFARRGRGPRRRRPAG